MFCSSCGAELPKGARFCPGCGQSCTVETGSEIREGITFEDELRPVNDVLSKPTNKEPGLNTASKKSQGHSPKTSVSSALLNSGSSEWRVLNENGSGNTSMEFFDDTLFAVAFIPDGDTLHMPLMADGKMIVSGPVGAFHIGRKSKLIFYLTEKYELMACDFHGKKTQKIAGGNGDRVLDFAVNEDQLFILLQGKNSNTSIFQIGQTLDTSNVLKKSERLRGLAANQDFLYYIEGTALTQYDLKTSSEKVIMSRTGINAFQLYNGHLILTISDNPFSTHDGDNQILLIDPTRMLQRTVVQVAAKNVNCYWDHVFYIDSKNERIWTVPLTGGTPHMLRNKATDSLNLACGHLYFIDCASVEFAAINLSSGKELLSNSEKLPEAASDAIKYSLLNQEPEHYKDYTLNQALLEGVSVLQELNSKSELFDYVVFLTLPQLNKKREDIPALLKAAGYQQKPGSEPIVFVDSTLSHKRGKGFIVATDGIYTDKTFFPYDYTIDCEREGGPQNIRLRTYEKVRFGKEKRTLDISCPMFKSGLEDLAELIYTIYAFSYFMAPSVSDGYLLPKPKDLSGHRQPRYIKVPKKSANENKKTSEDAAKNTVDQSAPKTDQVAADSHCTEEIKAAKEKEYVAEMDQLWRSRPFKDVFLYNLVKVFFNFLFPFSIGCTVIAGFIISEILSRHIQSSTILMIFNILLVIVGIVIIILSGAAMIGGCIALNEKISGVEGENIAKKYAQFDINSSYTPIGIRGNRNTVAVIAGWVTAIIATILLSEIELLL